MSLIRDLILWFLIRCWRVALMLAVVFLAFFIFYTLQRWSNSAEKEFRGFENQIRDAEAEIDKRLNLKQIAKSEIDALHTWKPWDSDPKMWFVWAPKYNFWKIAYDEAVELENKARGAKLNAIQGIKDAKEGRWWDFELARRCKAMMLSLTGYAVFGVFVLPMLWKAFWFYLVAPLARRCLCKSSVECSVQ